MNQAIKHHVEWRTLLVIVACTALVVLICLFGSAITLWVAVPVLSVLVALHSSVQHEVLHGHPFRVRWLNEWLVFVPFGLFIPYIRFRDTHLVHHRDEQLTDPYDDPESNYLDPLIWQRLPSWMQAILMFNNTLFGRMLIGPLVGLWYFYKTDIVAMKRGNLSVISAYLLHFSGLLLWFWWLLSYSTLPLWTHVVAAYVALMLLRVRTYLEHQAHLDVKGRTVIVEDTGFFAFLFLNNNLHLVHHTHPQAPWYTLPSLYRANRKNYLACNHHYVYANYWCVFAQYLFNRKDAVPHPYRK